MAKKKIIIIGAGAAGLLAAGKAAEDGADVIVFEKKERPGRKIRISGKGRCNLTNTAELKEFITHFGKNGKFLRQAFNEFFAEDLVGLMNELGVPTETERGGRIFPLGNDARLVVDALIKWVRNKGVRIVTKASVRTIIIKDETVIGVKTEDKNLADAVIVTTGGKSYPLTGSTGDGYIFAKTAGHTLLPPRPALVPLETSGNVAQQMQGLSLKNVTASVWVDNKKQAEQFGEMMFTHFGLTGPIILSLSQTVVDALAEKKTVTVAIDLKPALDEQKLDKRLQRDFADRSNQHFQNVLGGLLPKTMIPVCIDALSIPADKPAHQITSKERKSLKNWLKSFKFEISGHRGYKEAIVTAGGVSLKEINPRTMESKLIKNLYFAGEVLDLNGDTGGYNLQAAFSTGWLAGKSASITD
ncbi:MAG: NAD(P)/FAD-dependent oxidoreductase [candidate division Zixibacteria bacterium]|nr:NAD(P)/FAD-dependent oxidoreductase [candidate division Zixibacteria bacterium]